jgi:ADP-ribose pyrophosphatase YjhB (NUDIX family)
MKNPYKGKFEVIARAVIIENGKILLCRNPILKYYFFPGGHVEFGEDIKKALARELKEELGVKTLKMEFLGIVDNIYTEYGDKHHEINFVFKTKINKIHTKNKEDNRRFYFALLDMKEYKKNKVNPVALSKQILKWQKDKKFFWVSQK